MQITKLKEFKIFNGDRHNSFSVTDCSQRLTDPHGLVQSPDYPRSFDPDLNCVWQISAPEGYRIKLTFSDFVFHDVDSRRGCLDYLELREGDRPLAKFIGRYCGNDSPGEIISSNNLRISMHSEPSPRPVKGRFQAHYVAVGKFCIERPLLQIYTSVLRSHS